MSNASSLDTGRLARTLTLIVFVTAVFLFLTAGNFGGRVFQIGTVAIGTVGIITAIIGFLIAAGSAYDD